MLPHVEWKLLEQEGFDITQGEGELVVKTGAMMFEGYANQPHKTTSACTPDGFYKMGDTVRITLPEGVEHWDFTQPISGIGVWVDVLGRQSG